jgi:CheY-like chemotaxis protein
VLWINPDHQLESEAWIKSMIEPGSSPLPDLRVLVVEDNIPDVMLIEESLREMGYAFDLTHFADGEEAVSKLCTVNTGVKAFDVIILDINMPRISGLEVLSDLRSSESYRDTPILVLTSSLSQAEQTEALRLGASGFVKKPSDLFGFLNEVGGKVRELVNGVEKCGH